MPAVSRNQRIAMAIAEHHPEQLSPQNKGLLKMSHSQLHDFAATPEKGLPQRVSQQPKRRRYYGE
jgi:hypothetical protein